MAKLCFVTDSTADIGQELANELNIHIVPLKVTIDQETYIDGVTISPDFFFRKLEETEQIPTTSQPSPAQFEQKYRDLAQKYGEDVEIISIHLSSALSGTFQSANVGKMLVPNLDVTVIDSKKGAFLLGLIVVTAAKAAISGKSKEECLHLIHKMIEEQKEFFVVDTLTYLQKGGRIGKAQALVGSILNIKPILSLNEQGEVFAYDKVRGKKKAVSRMLEQLKEYAGEQPVVCGVIYARNLDEAEELKQTICEKFNVQEIYMVEIGPVIGAHIGPHALAAVMYKP